MSIPNILSVFRLLLVPVFVIVFFSGESDSYAFAAFVYAIACLTDVLDGMIARRFNQITKLGRVLDPLADKLMAFTVLVCIMIDGIIPIWAVVIFFVKECFMGIGALVMYKKLDDVIPSDKFGKAATACFFAVSVLLMVFHGIPHYVATIMILVPTVISLIALFHYLKLSLPMIRKKSADA